MSKNATNQKKGIVHRGSGHIAESTDTSLPYFDIGKETGNILDDNHIEVSKCAHSTAAQRTFIEGHPVIHHQTAIGHPYGDGGTTGYHSRYDRAHGNAKNNPPVFGWFAYPDEKSPDVMVEGKWVVRTFDKTWQDAKNGPGQFSPGPGSTEVMDESELLFQQCAVEKIELSCSHERSTLEGELHVFIGDVVKVRAFRVNASETDPQKRLDIHCHLPVLRQKKKVPAEETKHAAFVVSRNAGGIPPITVSWSVIEPKTLVGTDESERESDVPTAGPTHITGLLLGKEWLLESETANAGVGAAGGDYDSYDLRQDGSSVQHDHGSRQDRAFAERKLLRAQRRERSALSRPGRPGKASGALGQARRDITNAQQRLDAIKADEAQRAANKQTSAGFSAAARLALDSWSIIMNYWLYKPLTILVEAHGCSPGATATIKAYPIEEFGAELATLKDFPFRNTVERMSNLIETISSFFSAIKVANLRKFGPVATLNKPGGFNIDVYFFRSLKGALEDGEPSIELKFGFQELERDSNPDEGEVKNRKKWQVHQFWEIEAKLERLFGLTINFEVDLSYCLGLGTFITKVLSFCGVDTGVFLDIDVGLSVGIAGSIGRDEYGKIDTNFAEIPVKSVIQVSLVARAGKFFEAGIRLTGKWEPALDLEANDKGQLCLVRTECDIEIALTLEAKVDILGWDLDFAYEIAKWKIPVPGSPIVIFGDGV